MQKLMIATDFSERSDRALRRATLLAKETGASLTIVHVVDDDRPRRFVEHDRKDAEKLLHELAVTMQRIDGLASEVRVILADPFAGIVQAVIDAAPDLLVIGPHRRQVLRDMFVGTTAERTIRSVECPVLMVNGPPVGPYRHIMLTTDFSDNARKATQRFLALSLEPRARHSMLHVFDVLALRMGMSGTLPKEDRDFHINKQDAETRREMNKFTGGLGGQPMTVAVRYMETTEAAEIHKAADELGADLIVVSTQGKGAVARMVLGSVTQQVLQTAAVDVLVIPPDRSA